MNEQKEKKDGVVDAVLEKIKNHELTARPKAVFRLRVISFVIVSIAVFVMSVFLMSFIFFSIRVSGGHHLFEFGVSGFSSFLILFPWKLFVVDIIFLAVLGWLLRSFKFGYKSPIVYLGLGVIAVMFVSAVVVDRVADLHDRAFQIEKTEGLPFFGGMYENVRHTPPPPLGSGIYRGIIISVVGQNATISLDDPAGSASTTSYTVAIPQNIDLPEVGERVFLDGQFKDGTLENISRVVIIDRPGEF